MKKEIRLFYFMTMAYCISDILFGTCYVLIMYKIGLSANNIAFIIGLMGILGFILDFPSGNIADKIGRKKSIGFGFLIWGVGALVFYFSTSFSTYIISAVLSSLGLALYSGSPQAWIVDSLKIEGQEYKKNLIFYKSSTISTVLKFFGAVLGSLLIAVNLSLPIAAMACLLIVAGIIVLIVGKDNFGQSYTPNFLADIISTAISFAKNRTMRGIVFFRVLSTLPFIIFIVCWQLYLTKELFLPEKYIGVLLAVFMLSQSVAGFFLIKKKNKNPYINLFIGIIISLFGMAIINTTVFWGDRTINIYIFIMGTIIYEFGLGIEQSAGGAWIQDYIPDSKRASYFSAITAIISLFAFMFTTFVGYLIEVKGMFFPFHFALFMYAVYILYAKFCRFNKQ